MAAYAGATLYGSPVDLGWQARWQREKTIVRRKLGGGNSEDLQDVGFGNWFIELTIVVLDDVGVALLQAAVGLTKRSLTNFRGQTWANVMLTKCGAPRRSITEAAWEVDVRFEYEAA